MFRAIRRVLWKIKAKSLFANLNAAPQAKAALVAKYVADRETGLDAQKTAKIVVKNSPSQAKTSTYAHEELKGLAVEPVADRKPGELQPDRVSRSTRTEKRIREKAQAEWRKALNKKDKDGKK